MESKCCSPSGPDQDRAYVKLVRKTLAESLGLTEDQGSGGPPAIFPGLKGGLFVTLYYKGRLKGCMGHFDFELPLEKGLPEMALAAAYQDPRFPPLTKDMWPDIKVEISILTPPAPVAGLKGIEIGRHGLYLAHPEGRGVLLPQVAVERGWDAEELARQTAVKAGLRPDAWRDPRTRLAVFSARVIKEN